MSKFTVSDNYEKHLDGLRLTLAPPCVYYNKDTGHLSPDIESQHNGWLDQTLKNSRIEHYVHPLEYEVILVSPSLEVGSEITCVEITCVVISEVDPYKNHRNGMCTICIGEGSDITELLNECIRAAWQNLCPDIE